MKNPNQKYKLYPCHYKFPGCEKRVKRMWGGTHSCFSCKNANKKNYLKRKIKNEKKKESKI